MTQEPVGQIGTRKSSEKELARDRVAVSLQLAKTRSRKQHHDFSISPTLHQIDVRGNNKLNQKFISWKMKLTSCTYWGCTFVIRLFLEQTFRPKKLLAVLPKRFARVH